ncbi:AhpC/TSA family protein [Bacteroidia bacterium]|nr:AhpC/TSA family protein [Bacteroidia bacterium]MDC0104384.1 AhpC/TSA family protein [Bacteroidia bacterium]
MKNWIGVLAILCVASVVFATKTSEGAKGYKIQVTSNLAKKTLVVLSKITDAKLEIQDSAYAAKDGAFNFTGSGSEGSSLYYLTFGNTTPPGIPVILEHGAQVKLGVTKVGAAYDITLVGGEYNKSMLKLYNLYTGFEKEMAAFNAEVATIDATTVTEEIRTNTTQRYNKMISSRSEAIEQFIQNEPASPATYFAVKYLFQKPASKLILIAADKMEKELPNSLYTKNLVSLAANIGPTVEGAIAPEISLKTPEGEILALSSLRGKVVLIDFWASWCGPCRKENPNVKKIYEKYKDQGFEIYAVSLDNNAAQWKGAIAKDGLAWKHVSELLGWKGAVSRAYGVGSIPQTFLLDKEGRIVKTGFRSHELESLIQPLLQ